MRVDAAIIFVVEWRHQVLKKTVEILKPKET